MVKWFIGQMGKALSKIQRAGLKPCIEAAEVFPNRPFTNRPFNRIYAEAASQTF
jgi:hypothetical protein